MNPKITYLTEDYIYTFDDKGKAKAHDINKLLNKNMSFEQYLQEQHAKQYQGLDDEMPDDYNDWKENLSGDDMQEYAEDFFDIVQGNIKKGWEDLGKLINK